MKISEASNLKLYLIKVLGSVFYKSCIKCMFASGNADGCTLFPKRRILAVVTIELEANNSIGGLKDPLLLRFFAKIPENQCLINKGYKLSCLTSSCCLLLPSKLL